MQDSIIKYQQAVFDKNKLTIKEDTNFEQWKEIGKLLQKVEGSVQFWIGDWACFGEKKGFTGKYTSPEVYDQIQEQTGLSRKTVKNCKYVADNIKSSRRHDDLSFGHHYEVAKLPTEKQTEYLRLASEQKLSVRELRKKIREEERRLSSSDMPGEKYRIIYVDPPWKYNDELTEDYGAAEHHYSTMSIDELCEFSLPDIENDAVLFLWVTSPLLEDSFRVVHAWGFEYKTSFVWDKVKHNMGHYNSVRHEFLLVCTKGTCTPDVMKLYDSVQSIERTEVHSQKPEEFRNIIDTLYPYGKRIELFSRTNAENWDRYGNELL